MKLDQHYVDLRLVELYDIENTRGVDTDFYLSLAAELEAKKILDLGCGTGLLTLELARVGHEVIGVDPATAMLNIARRQPDASLVRWVEGDSTALGTPNADLLTMTGNVAQVFLEDSEWLTVLHHIHAALRSGGYLAFESRNPDAHEWERWNRESTYEQIDSPFGLMECWLELIRVGNGCVLFEGHNIFKTTGEVVVASSELRFRTREELTGSLIDAGFVVESVYGDWHRGSLTDNSRVMVFVARLN
jgi:SAM-dependent methyltransferase